MLKTKLFTDVNKQTPEFMFQIGDRLADGRLSDEQCIGGFLETIVFVNCFEHSDLMGLYVKWHEEIPFDGWNICRTRLS